ncbi:MAG: NADPH-dependent FMN reductase [Ilumatobacter sp.]
MKILAFAATASTRSINRKIVDYASSLLTAGLLDGVDVEVETIDLDDFEMPIYSEDRERDGGIPKLAHDFFEAIGDADAVLISFAEHNGFYTAAYKNLFDWTSRIDMKVYQGKPVVLFSTSPGQGGGANVLNTAVMSGTFFGYDVKASLAIPSFYENFDTAADSLSNDDLDSSLRAALLTLAS